MLAFVVCADENKKHVNYNNNSACYDSKKYMYVE